MKHRDFSKINWDDIENEIGNVLGEDFWKDLAGVLPNPHSGPHVDAFEYDHYVYVIAELPGLQSVEGIRVALKNSVLTIEGELLSGYPVTAEQMIKAERFFGRFKKEIQLPTPVDPNTIRARYVNGVLEIAMIKTIQEEKNIFIEYQGDNLPPY